jgi:hypothetical protein
MKVPLGGTLMLYSGPPPESPGEPADPRTLLAAIAPTPEQAEQQIAESERHWLSATAKAAMTTERVLATARKE